MESKGFQVFTHCKLVKGVTRSAIYDLLREEMQLVPNSLYEVLTQHPGKTLEQVKEHYNNEHDAIIDEYFQMLEEHEYIFWTDEPELFPPLDLTYESPQAIENAIVDWGPNSEHPWSKIIRELNDLGCQHLEIRVFSDARYQKLLPQILQLSEGSRLRSIQLFLPYSHAIPVSYFSEIFHQHGRVGKINIHSTPSDTIEPPKFGGRLEYFEFKLSSEACCGVIHSGYFMYNQPTFLLGQQHNTCLYKKISIDQQGMIKNCPSMTTGYGDIATHSLHNALAQKNFKSLWDVNKDQIEICKDCEFRYACTDCRAYISDDKDLFSKPSKCNYDPYTGTWQD